MAGRLTRQSFGPFVAGALDRANALIGLQGVLKEASNVEIVGANALRVRGGTTAVMTFQDDAMTPAAVTSIRAVVPFTDGALVVGHSTTTDKAYLYHVNSTFTKYYNASDSLQTGTTATPTRVIWTSMQDAPDVVIAEGLGVAYIAHATAADSSALNWATKQYVFDTATDPLASLTSDLDASGAAEDLYFSGVVSFQNHLWGWGFGSGTTAANGYRPELARFSQIYFDDSGDLFAPSDSITLGDRVRSDRERIVAGFVAGNALFFASQSQVTRVVGFDRDSWYRTALDKSYGIVGPKAYAIAGDVAYWWSTNGPMRATDSGPAEPLWDPIPEAARAVREGGAAVSVVGAFDKSRNQVQFYYQPNGTVGLKQFAAFDVRREVWLGPSSQVGVEVACAGLVDEVLSVDSTPPGPAGAPSSLTFASAGVGDTVATGTWTLGDATAESVLEYKRNVDSTYTVLPALAPGVTSRQITGLMADTLYDARVKHVKNGQDSAYDTEQFTTTDGTLLPPNGISLSALIPSGGDVSVDLSGEAVETEVHLAGPSASEPSAGAYALYDTLAQGVSSTTVTVGTNGTYWVKARHKQGSNTSTFTTAASDALVAG